MTVAEDAHVVVQPELTDCTVDVEVEQDLLLLHLLLTVLEVTLLQTFHGLREQFVSYDYETEQPETKPANVHSSV